METNFDRLLREKHLPTSVIAHYTKKETFLERILPSGKLRFGRLSETNDPRESKAWSFPSCSIKDANRENIDTLSQRVNEHLNHALRDRSYVCCGTKNNPADKYNCYLRSRMWTQYGDDHQGVCLLLDRDRMDFEVRRELRENDELLSEAVVYSNEYPFPAPPRFDAAALESSVDQFLSNREHRHYFLFQKQTDWLDEDEYRWIIVAPDSSKPEYFISLDNVLAGIVLGIDWPRIYTKRLKDRFPQSSKVLLGEAKNMYMDCLLVRHFFGASDGERPA